jgi:hypothetical protein
MLILQEEVEDTKGAIITRTYKAMAKRKKDKRAQHDLQNTMQKLKIKQREPYL